MPKTEAPGEGVVTGYGTVDGRLVYAYAQDFRLSVVLWVKCRQQKFAKLWTWQQKWVLLSSELTIPAAQEFRKVLTL